jgi:hypothetical protein
MSHFVDGLIGTTTHHNPHLQQSPIYGTLNVVPWLWKEAKIKKEKSALRSLRTEKNRGIRSEVPQDESQVSVGGLLALGYGRKRRTSKKR